MRIERTIRNDLSADQTYEMSTSKEFQERKCQDAAALSYDVRVTDGDDGKVVSTRRKLPTGGFPSILRTLLPGGVSATETVVWGAVAEDGSRTAQLSVDFHGPPVAMNGTIRIVPGDERSSTVEVNADFTANVPLIGSKVERFAAPVILDIIDSEEATGRKWAAEL